MVSHFSPASALWWARQRYETREMQVAEPEEEQVVHANAER